METRLQSTGGAQVGWVHASWPFAKLTASAHELSLSATLLGSYKFSPDQVAALEAHGSIPILGSGVRIVHTVQNYPEKIVFWCPGSPKRLIEKIIALGFHPRAARAQVPQRDGIPFRWSFLVAVVLVWNALFLLDGIPPKIPGAYSLLAIVLLFLTALALNFSGAFQAVVLKPGRSISEVRSIAQLVLLVSAILLIGFGVQHIAS
ncbi:MAG: hypothetical protein A3H27_05695 [Acidobacteria bacterium RIFCSPLOWO2_02_FULL_59_13]|nr:MAG: hypothetical protein A3H27_05695 [Acidobacteria bacterium RIFCSPLOWO2_02_FULL_59_13]